MTTTRSRPAGETRAAAMGASGDPSRPYHSTPTTWRQPLPSARDLFEQHYGVEFHGSGPNVRGRCPFPGVCDGRRDWALSVNTETDAWQCWRCGRAGNNVTLAQELGLLASKSYLQGFPSGFAVNNFFGTKRVSAPPSEGPSGCLEAAALEALGESERARKIAGCRTRWRVGHCGNCGGSPAYPLSCGDRLCPRCRAELLSKFLAKHLDKLSAEAVGSLLEVGVAQGGDGLSPEDLVAGLEHLRRTINESLRALKASGWCYAFRLVREDGGWRILALVLVVGDEKAGFLASMLFVQQGLSVGKGAQYGVNARGALEQLVRWAGKPYVGLKTAADVEAVALALKGRRAIQGVGLLYRVAGGATAGKATVGGVRVKPKPCCSICGSDNVMWVFTVDAAEIVLDDGPPRWRGIADEDGEGDIEV